MTRTDLSFTLPFLLVSASARPAQVHCTLFESPLQTVLFVEAPNWANAVQWGPAMAFRAWELLRASETRKNQWNPADLEYFFMYRLRPGFPSDGMPLWREPFTYYENIARAPTLVQRLTPVSGTGLVRERGHEALTQVFERHGLASSTNLQRFTADAKLSD
jgi:hypothetical protein